MSKQAGEVARRTAKIIETQGWHQHGWTNRINAGKSWGKAEVCIRGAFNLAAWGRLMENPSQAEIEFTKWLNEIDPLPQCESITLRYNPDLDDLDLAAWNDKPERTKDEVLAYLNKFAEEQDPQPAIGEAQ